MPHPVSLSKSKLLSFIQCPRRLWLEQYRPELEEPSPELDEIFRAGERVGATARRVFGECGMMIDSSRGLRNAVEQTAGELERGGSTPIFDASFEYEDLVVQVDIFDRSRPRPRLVEVEASSRIEHTHIDDCAIQAWTLERLGHELGSVCIAHVDPDFVYGGDDDYRGLFAEEDVSTRVKDRLAGIPDIVDGARDILRSLDEPDVSIGEHCCSGYRCPFFDHCRPPQGRYPVESLGGPKEEIFEWLEAGYGDLRDVPEAELGSDSQRLIWQSTRSGAAFFGDGFAAPAAALDFPTYFVEFGSIDFAVPIWPETSPYEGLPYQWSCHLADGPDDDVRRLENGEFLDVSGGPPMRACAERLIEALGTEGPIFIYTPSEHSVVDRLAMRFEDIRPALGSIVERLVNLYPFAKDNYYHPDMQGSWSLEAILPTIAPGAHDSLGVVRDEIAARAAYLEAIAPNTSEARRAKLETDLLAYRRRNSLAIVELLRLLSAHSVR